MATERSFDDIPNLSHCLFELLRQIPPGRVTTYGALAAALGSSAAARWVGLFLRRHLHDASCPCHRVVYRDGTLGEFVTGDPQVKAALLQAEGVRFVPPRPVRGASTTASESLMVDLAEYGFGERDFVGDRPLARLRQWQQSLAGKVVLEPFDAPPNLVGGLDISYPSPDEGVAAYTLLQWPSARRIWSHTVRRPVRFPYIPTYLTFRELPIHLALLDEVRAAGRLAPLIMVDGTGVLHPHRFGIASHLGVVAQIPTIGVTKKLLCGHVDLEGFEPLESRPVEYQGQAVGVAIRPTAASRRPIFVSPGHRIDLAGAEAFVRGVLQGRRLPEPLFWADRISREAGKNR